MGRIKLLLLLIVGATILLTVVVSLQMLVSQQHAATAPSATAVTTYQSIGLYWSPSDGSSTNQCNVQYRVQGTTAWKQAMPLWYDGRALGGRPAEYRGSIVLLQSGTTYEIQLTLASGTTTTLTATTWSENYPIVQTITVPSGGAYNITQGGSANEYILYTGPATINGGSSQNAITVNASYVIVRGLTVTGGSENAVFITNNAHDVVIEKNDISHWGPSCSGYNHPCGELASGVRAADNGNFYHLTIQRNKIHDPNANSNTSCEPVDYTHPSGPRSVALPDDAVNNVIRYNEVWSDINHLWNDSMGENDNHSFKGFPNRDSDVNGNILMDSADDNPEIEGADMNVRVWGNFIDRTFTGVSSASDALGPLYIFRNVMGRSEKCPRNPNVGGYVVTGEHGPFDKLGDINPTGGGRRYLFHNTLLQPGGGQGANLGPADYGDSPMANTVSRNNIWNGNGGCYSIGAGVANDLDYDLCPQNPIGAHSIQAKPIYVAGGGDNIQLPSVGDALPAGYTFALASNSPGYHAGIQIPNFNDDFGSKPDIGAQSSSGPNMEFGVTAYLTNTLSPTNSTGGTQFTVTVCPHGLGNCGDNANPNAGGNTNPLHLSKPITLTLLTGSNQPVATGQGMVMYNTAAQNFQGTITVPNLFTGQYLISIKMDGYLSKQYPGIISPSTSSGSSTITLSALSLVTGDINKDNQLDILDYNLLISCFGSKQNSSSCPARPTIQSPGADINDNGSVAGDDYNLFLRELSVQR